MNIRETMLPHAHSYTRPHLNTFSHHSVVRSGPCGFYSGSGREHQRCKFYDDTGAEFTNTDPEQASTTTATLANDIADKNIRDVQHTHYYDKLSLTIRYGSFLLSLGDLYDCTLADIEEDHAYCNSLNPTHPGIVGQVINRPNWTSTLTPLLNTSSGGISLRRVGTLHHNHYLEHYAADIDHGNLTHFDYTTCGHMHQDCVPDGNLSEPRVAYRSTWMDGDSDDAEC